MKDAKGYRKVEDLRKAYSAAFIGKKCMVKTADGALQYQGYFLGLNPGSESVKLKYPCLVKRWESKRGGDPFLEKIPCKDVVIDVDKFSSFLIKDIIERLDDFTHTRGTDKALPTNVRRGKKVEDDALTDTQFFQKKRELQRFQFGGKKVEEFELDKNKYELSSFDQFRENEQKHNYKTSYDEKYYTTQLDKSKLTKEQIQRADRVVKQINQESVKNPHIAAERGEEVDELDQEKLFSTADYREQP